MKQHKTGIQFFQWYCSDDGSHWNHFKEQVAQLARLGVTAAWLPPAYKGTRGAASEGYDVYDIYDLGEFDQKGTVRTKYGTKQQYIEAVRHARANGIQVYIDVVLNHMGGAEETEKIKVMKVHPEDRTRFISDEMQIEAFTKFTFAGRNKKYSDFNWDHTCFTGIDYAADTKENAIFSIHNEYGDDWEPMTHIEKGNFDYLILNDIETRNPHVREELKKWIKWYYETVTFDGVRLDAVKHINPSFFIEWIDYIKRNVNKDLFILGEFWLSDNLQVLLDYIQITEGRMSLFDAPLHHNLSIASKEKEKYDLRTIFDNTLVQSVLLLAVTFVDNHDTQPLQSLEEYTEQWFKPHAYAFILLRKDGYPFVFYPDLYGCCYSGKSKNPDHYEIKIPALESLPALMECRKKYSYGKQVDYFVNENYIGWVRQGDVSFENSGCAIVLNNNPEMESAINMSIGRQHAGKFFIDILGHSTATIIIDESGMANFSAMPASVSVWIMKG